MRTIKLTTFNDLGDCDRQDVNDLISALVRMGYEVWMTDTFVCFNLGNEDVIKDEKNENNSD
jgi:IS1 family transposase